MRPDGGEAQGPDPEPAVREALAAAHRAEIPPPFARLWRAGERGRRRRAWLALPAGAVAAAALAVLLTGRGPDRPVPALPAWTSPTDFLLEVRGLDFLRTAPALEAPAPLAGDPGADPLKGVLP